MTVLFQIEDNYTHHQKNTSKRQWHSQILQIVATDHNLVMTFKNTSNV